MRISISTYTFVAILLLGNSVFSQVAQDLTDNDISPGIRWVGQYPPLPGEEEKSFLEKMDQLLFGSRPPQIIKPVAAIKDADETLWILSQGIGKIVTISANKGRDPNVIKKHYNPFPSLVSACFVPGKGVLFTDSYLNKVFQPDPLEGTFIEFNSSDSLDQPTGIAYSASKDQVWIVETAAHRISLFNSNGSFIKTIGNRGSGPGQFNFPTHIWIDSSGKAYVVDAMNFRVQIFDSNGAYLSSFGEAGNASGSFARPKGIATDSKGNIYIADGLFSSIQVFDVSGRLLYYFGSKGTDKEQFLMPTGIFIDHKDYIYVADSYNNRVQVYQLTEGKAYEE